MPQLAAPHVCYIFRKGAQIQTVEIDGDYFRERRTEVADGTPRNIDALLGGLERLGQTHIVKWLRTNAE